VTGGHSPDTPDAEYTRTGMPHFEWLSLAHPGTRVMGTWTRALLAIVLGWLIVFVAFWATGALR
jgi:hypothetical protein